MEGWWFTIIITLCISAIINSLLRFLFTKTPHRSLPPGPISVPVIGNLLWLQKSLSETESIIRNLKSKYGPIITLRIGSRPFIFVSSHSLAHSALIQNGAVFSDRPKTPAVSKIFNSNQHNISSAAYGPTWRLLRRNLTSEILHPSRVKSYSGARKWVLGILVERLLVKQSQQVVSVEVMEEFRFAMFCLLALLCFGDKLREDQIEEIETVQRGLLLQFSRYRKLNFWPRLGKILFRKEWKDVIQLRKNQENLLIPFIKARIEAKNQSLKPNMEESVAYVDTLVDLQLPEENRKLTDQEMVSLCSEFLNAGTDTTSTALQWIMANLVKHPHVQDKLYQEIVGVVGSSPRPLTSSTNENSGDHPREFVSEEDLHNMPYLKAVVLEALRRHPPGHFVLPHSVTEEMELDGYVIPKNAVVNFTVADMGWDPKVWENPMEFKPERFMNANGDDAFDITGSREIKMMPFGAGRRICPGFALALLHLEYFVANLVWYFEWKAVDGVGVDLSEKPEFTVVMKNPLHAHISPRHK